MSNVDVSQTIMLAGKPFETKIRTDSSETLVQNSEIVNLLHIGLSVYI